jgi:aspartate/methionine/tyrosine aminotransferase
MIPTMKYRRMPIERESPEELGYGNIACNLSESSVSDAVLGELRIRLEDLTLLYCEHRGDLRLRELIAASHPGIGPEHVLVTAGAAAALFIVHTTLLEKGDHVVVEHPNYGTNLETPRAIGCALDRLTLEFESGFQPDLDRLRRTAGTHTRLISVTNPHNPTGALKPPATIEEMLRIAADRKCRLLVDETYRDVSQVEKPTLAAALDPRAISVSSLSKAYGLPGLRIGWIVCRDAALLEDFLAAKEQIFICNSVVDETIALQFLEKRDEFLPRIRERTARNYALLRSFMAEKPWLEWVEPQAAVVAFPRFRREIDLDVEAFYRVLLSEYRTMVGPGHWFEMDDRYLRIGFGWPEEAAMRQGLDSIDAAARRTVRR